MIIDLGCGKNKRGDIGIDYNPKSDADIVCLLGFDPIPLVDNYADKVIAYDLLEHIPFVIYQDKQIKYPIIYLMNEIWRILKPNGIFEMTVPCYPSPFCFSHPTHTSVWTEDTIKFFLDIPPVFHPNWFKVKESYGIQCQFKLLEHKKLDTVRIKSVLQAIKNA